MVPSGQLSGSQSAIQGINSGLGMVNVDLLHISNFAQTGNLGIHAVKAAGGLELAQPGICVIASHIVVGMVTGNHHQGAQDNLGVTGFLDLFDHSLAGGVFRLALNSANEHIIIAQGLHGGLHLAVADLCGVGSAVAHEHKSSAIGGSSGGVIVEGIDNCLINMARCCAPVPGEEIIGFITRGHGLTIHRRDCVNVPRDLAECPEPERWVKARWDDSVQVETMSTLEVYAIDRDGLVLDIANAMSKAHVKIQSINARPINEGNCLTTLTLSVNSREHLENVVKILKKIPSVYHIERGAGR